MKFFALVLAFAACKSEQAPVVIEAKASVDTVPAGTKLRNDSARFETRDGKRYAIGTSSVVMKNEELAKKMGANRARVAILRLLQNKGPNESVEGSLEGARVVKEETTENGFLVEVEVEAPE